MAVRRKVFRIEESLQRRSDVAADAPARSGDAALEIVRVAARPDVRVPARAAALPDEGIARIDAELRAVIGGTAAAVRTILNAAEAIDRAVVTLALAAAPDGGDATLHQLRVVRERVAQIFEACNFQDIGGQRLVKVIDALGAFERRFADLHAAGCPIARLGVAAATAPQDERGLLKGPRLDDEPGHCSQDEVDAMLGRA